MTYAVGSRTSQANPAADLYSLISAQLTAHGGYTFIEDWTVTTTIHSVWRCNGAQNSMGTDFFLIFSRSTAAGALTLSLGVAEGYVTASHSYVRPAPNMSTTTHTFSANGAYTTATETYALSATISPTTLFQDSLTTATSAYDYWLHVHKDGVNLATRVGTTTYSMGCESFESLVTTPATNDPVPLVSYGGNLAAAGGITRQPFFNASTPTLTRVLRLADFGRAVTASEWPTAAVSGVVGGAGNLYQGGRPVGARLMVRTEAQHAATHPVDVVGWNRGLFRTLLSYALATGVVTGDTMTVGADTYVLVVAAQRTYWFNSSAA